MPRYTVTMLVAVVVGAAAAWTVAAWTVAAQRLPVPILECLHDPGAPEAHRMRRDRALALARAINAAEREAVARTQRYQPLGTFPDLPPTPEGFALRLYTDGTGYLFSLKDTRDPCHYGIFSDQEGRLYEHTTQRPLIAS